jgi:hypothetical protein
MPLSKHDYPDGDVIIELKDKSFKVHKLVLGLASDVFKDLFTNAISKTSGKEIPKLPLDEPIQTFEDLLDFIYPGCSLSITWDNIRELFRIADKYMIDSFIERGKEFLERYFQSKPLLSLVLADLYRFKDIYKQSSKLVLDNFTFYKSHQLFNQLSVITRESLLNRYCNYLISWSKDYQEKDFVEDFTHTCVGYNTKDHVKKISNKIVNKLKSTRTFPPPNPSMFYRMVLKVLQEKSYDMVSCDYNDRFFSEFPNMFKNYFGEFEPLENDDHDDNNSNVTTEDEICDFYIFIEMK